MTITDDDDNDDDNISATKPKETFFAIHLLAIAMCVCMSVLNFSSFWSPPAHTHTHTLLLHSSNPSCSRTYMKYICSVISTLFFLLLLFSSADSLSLQLPSAVVATNGQCQLPDHHTNNDLLLCTTHK